MVPRKTLADLEEVFGPMDLAEVLDMGRNQMYEALSRREIPARRIGRRFFLYKPVIVEWLQRCDG